MTLGPLPDSGQPRVLFDTGILTNPSVDQYRASPDGQRFLLLKPANPRTTPIQVIVNWAATLNGPLDSQGGASLGELVRTLATPSDGE